MHFNPSLHHFPSLNVFLIPYFRAEGDMVLNWSFSYHDEPRAICKSTLNLFIHPSCVCLLSPFASSANKIYLITWAVYLHAPFTHFLCILMDKITWRYIHTYTGNIPLRFLYEMSSSHSFYRFVGIASIMTIFHSTKSRTFFIGPRGTTERVYLRVWVFWGPRDSQKYGNDYNQIS